MMKRLAGALSYEIAYGRVNLSDSESDTDEDYQEYARGDPFEDEVYDISPCHDAITRNATTIDEYEDEDP